MNLKPNYGPFQEWENIAAYSALSDRAFKLFDEAIAANQDKLSSVYHHLLLRCMYQARTTSFAIGLNVSWVLLQPAFALCRVRLEQTIVTSFLLHEDVNEGLKRFILHTRVSDFRSMKLAKENPKLAQNLTKFEIDDLKAKAAVAQEKLDPSFTLEGGKFERSWTKLDLRSMAKRRDDLATNGKRLQKQSLELQYISFYVQASSIVHADCSSISHHFLDYFPGPDGKPVLMPPPSLANSIAAATANYDILEW
jgi:hypothetical protein